MNAADNLFKMTNLITQSRHCVSLLIDCLDSELEYLRSNNSEQLIELSQQKNTLMGELQSYEQQRKQLINMNNISTKQDYLQWLADIDPSLELQKQWNELSQNILMCQEKNSTNGIIADNMATASKQALNILSGNLTPADNTYNADGSKPDASASLHNVTA